MFRNHFLFGNFIPIQGGISNPYYRQYLLKKMENRLLTVLPSSQVKLDDHCVYVYDGSSYHTFNDLYQYQADIVYYLNLIIKKRWKSLIQKIGSYDIGVHIRRGDFKKPTTKSDFKTKGAIQTPDEWFIFAVNHLKSMYNLKGQTLIVSDDQPESLQIIKKELNAKIVNSKVPIVDLMALANTQLLIGSGGSSFSAWAAFIGQLPVYTIEGQSLQWFGLDPSTQIVETLPVNL